MKLKRLITFLLFSILFSSCVTAQVETQPSNLSQKDIFINNKMKSMSLQDKIGQIIIIASDTKNNAPYVNMISKSIDSLNIGGICFFKGSGDIMLELNKTYSKIAKTPLLFSIDGEWGLGMRMTDGYSFPRQISIGATDNDSLVYEMGKNIALQAKAMGIHLNFAPCVDINQNPKNPVIDSRSFGENKERVAKLSWAYAKGMQDNGVLGSLKHFPGHGDTEVDSHYDLPIINHTKGFIDSIDTYPFRYSIDRGAKMVMIGHLNIPSLISDPKLPSSLSKDIIDDYLRKDLKFNGLVITDALNMSGVTKNYTDGEAEVRALMAGVDILLMPKNEYKAVSSILKAIKDKRISEKDIDRKCRKVLELKYDLGLFSETKKEISLPSKALINEAEEISTQISEKIITLVKNTDNNLPIVDRTNAKIAIVQLGNEDINDFTSTINTYNDAKLYQVKNGDSIQKIALELQDFDYIITVICGDITKRAKDNYGVSKKAVENLKFLQNDYNVILALFANPYSLKLFDSLDCINSILLGYENMPYMQKALANSIFGLNDVEGKLPVTCTDNLRVNHSLKYNEDMMYWANYVENGIKVEYLKKIDSIANKGISLGAYPGCQVVVLHENDIIYSKSYGYLTYDSIARVNTNTIYDVASVTKALSTTLAMMKLYQEDKYDLDDKLSKYLPYLKSTNKKKITIKQALSHNAQLKAWVPFYTETLKDKKPDPLYYSFNPSAIKDYLIVCDSLYIKQNYRDEILKKIAKSDLNKNEGYVYSDLGFILLGDMIEVISKMKLDEYVSKNFYTPMELNHTSFNPRTKFSIDNIAPTENDNYFRNKLIRGYVHDQTAAMMGGVAGHAGLFSNAMDIAKICQMLMNEGIYKGKQYIDEKTIETFNKTYFKNNRRVLGFDKPVINSKTNNSPCSKYASEKSYGHTGFTGTYFWIDPVEKIAVIFLSNRVYPSANDNKLSKLNIRTSIHDVVYEGIRDGQKNKSIKDED
ncbi:MAG: glycoside hydrolase family 3 N-terminal domain-containing protein [Bacteroidales bacterium]|nr:glycoside hydrolase family 3 N-terminal domain-containing protein [Bacteroidales bacterium]